MYGLYAIVFFHAATGQMAVSGHPPMRWEECVELVLSYDAAPLEGKCVPWVAWDAERS